MNKQAKIGAPSMWVAGVTLAVAGCLGGVAYSYLDLTSGESAGGEYQGVATSMRSLSQQIEVSALESVDGDAAGFAELGQLVDGFQQQLNALQPSGLYEETSLIEVNWLPVEKAALSLIEVGPQVTLVNEVADQFEQDVAAIQEGFGAAAASLQGKRVSPATIIAAQQSLLLTERIGKNISKIAAGADAPVAQELRADTGQLVAITESLLKGNPGKGIDAVSDPAAKDGLNTAFSLLSGVATSVDKVASATPALNKAAAARQTILDSSVPFSESLAGLTLAVAGTAAAPAGSSMTVMVAAAVALAVLALAALFGGQRRQAGRISAGMEDISEALLKIAAGDLTVRVSEDNALTSDIAREINASTERQRELVRNIRSPFDVAVDGIHKIGATARGQVEKARELTTAVAGSATAATEMVRASEEIKASTAEAARTSERNSEQVAHGYELTQDMSRASADVRESVQETSKSAKRQGELIQSVTAAAEYIQALNTKISVVAINTRIEAEKAGEHGRPFLGIADSIAELLREAEEEGRKIISQVRTLQNLSAENLASMENTVGTVVTILEYIDKLDSSLEEISGGSAAIGTIVKSVDDAAAKSAVSALRMNSAMAEIRERNLEIGKFSETSQKGVNSLQVSMRDVADSLNQFKVDENAATQKPNGAELEEIASVRSAKTTPRSKTVELAEKRRA